MSQSCFDDLPEYGENSCSENQQADIDALAVIDRDQTDITDYTVAAQWTAAIAADDVRIIKNIRAWIPEPAERTQGNPRTQGPENILNGFNLTIQFEDANVSTTNDAFYAALNGRTSYAAARFYYEGKIRVGLFPFYWIVKPVYGESNNVLKYSGTAVAKIGPDDYMQEYTEPLGIFD